MERIILLFSFVLMALTGQSQSSVARQWNEVLLEAIRQDFARPTVHARNLHHVSAAMYDAWAAYDDVATTYFLGKTVDGFSIRYQGRADTSDVLASQEEAMSYAAYRLLSHRFKESPGAVSSLQMFEQLMVQLAYDPSYTSTDYANSKPAALGNYIGESIIQFGLQDGSNEHNSFDNIFYSPINPSLRPTFIGNEVLIDPNRWQPLSFNVFIDQSGQLLNDNTPAFLSPEWGQVSPFALTDRDKSIRTRNGNDYTVYYDPGQPPSLGTQTTSANLPEEYIWGMALVLAWSAHLDTADHQVLDISPGSIGDLDELPELFTDYSSFYNFTDGGDSSQGRSTNPSTNLPYTSNVVLRADYARVLAEFWADGPDSETPPGHWFTILNYVNDHPQRSKRYRGQGSELSNLEWDIKSYFVLGGAVHDAAVTAWGIKGWYDYIRPISAIRWMSQWQSSDPNLPNYSENGLPLIPGLIEIIQPGDPLAGGNNGNAGKLKIRAWRGHRYVINPESDQAGVGWIRPEIWWPYQRPTFVTPPFAGYISGHSTFSRAAAEVLTLFTGDEFFPGGIGEFTARKNDFLVFEEGPSEDITLQWATYRDASDQTSLSRIWGGIHPPCDDIPGRIIGEKIGIQAFNFADNYFNGLVPNDVLNNDIPELIIYPNPISAGGLLTIDISDVSDIPVKLYLYDGLGQQVWIDDNELTTSHRHIDLRSLNLSNGVFFLRIKGSDIDHLEEIVIMR